MLIVTKKANRILKEKNISHYKLSQLIKKDEGYINNIFRGVQSFSDNVIKKLLPILEVPKSEFESWILADKYPKEVIQLAIEAKKKKNKEYKLVLTAKIDELLKEKGLSRTAFSKQIKHSQSSFNNAITGKESLSKNLMLKISQGLNIELKTIQTWVVADKYSLKILQLAANIDNER
jgi:transcriptional regulator with XRE-family HTH domain